MRCERDCLNCPLPVCKHDLEDSKKKVDTSSQDKIKEKSRRYYAAHREELIEKSRNYYREHRDEINAKRKLKYAAKKMAVAGKKVRPCIKRQGRK